MRKLEQIGLLALAVMFLQVAPAAATERPHHTRAAGYFLNANDLIAWGYETHLGSFVDVGSAEFTPTDEPGVLHFEGWGIHTAANGDQLFDMVSGQLNVLTGAGAGTVSYVGGTGRFANASGSSVISVQVFPDGTFEYSGEGTIDY